MENLPEIIDACDRLIVTFGDQIMRRAVFENTVGVSVFGFTFVVLPLLVFGFFMLGVHRNWW